MWRSLVARVVRDDEVAGSNPVIPTDSPGPLDRGFVVPAVFLVQIPEQFPAQILTHIEATPYPRRNASKGVAFMLSSDLPSHDRR